VYDGFGNLYQKNVTAGSAPSMSLVVDPTTNRLTNPGGTAFTYDANGNELSGPNVTGTLTYDFLNRAVFTGTAYYQNTQYAYDASNRRVWKGTMTNGAITAEAIYLYDVDGTNVGTYTPSLSVFHNGSYNYQVFELTLAQGRSYFFGKKLFVTEDNVGSAESNGTFYPFGEPKTGSTSEAYGFATYWQDSESGLDYAMNRYYSSTLGRFLSPDPYKANNGGPGDPRDPQSWNRYAYVENDPVNRNDRRGLFSGSAEDCISDPEACEDDDWGDGMLPGQPPSFPGSQTYTWQVWVGILASSATASNWGKTYGIPNFYFPLMIVEVSDTCKMGNMTGIPPTTDADRQISYQVFDQYGQPWNASTMGNITITEIVQSTGGTRVNGGGVWSTNTTNTEQLISSSGTFSDFLTLGSFLAGQLPPGSADQMFFATGAFAAIPLLIKIEGTGGYVNHNYYSHNTVLVDGTQAPGGCK
jgi:RHS repeat-associated protein